MNGGDTTMLRAIVATSTAALVALSSRSSNAQTSAATGTSFGEQGEFILGVDRLVPLIAYQSDSTSQTANGTTMSISDSRSSIDFLQNPFGAASGAGPSFYNMPRIGLDYVVVPNLTIGGNVIVGFSLGGTHQVQTTVGSTTTTKDTSEPSYTLLGISPRVGYIFALNELFAFWPRGGFSFYSLKTTTPTLDMNGNTTSTASQTFDQLALNLEGMFVWTPLPHFGVTGGPILDIPFTGSANTSTTAQGMTNTTSVSFSSWHLGAGLGIITYF
jgi:hypothetical protein